MRQPIWASGRIFACEKDMEDKSSGHRVLPSALYTRVRRAFQPQLNVGDKDANERQ